MSRSLSGTFQIDREQPPRQFFTPSRKITTSSGQLLVPGAHVLAESDVSSLPGVLIVGHISRQTPFGQGTGYKFHRTDIRRATRAEVRTALHLNHPAGVSFRPKCREITYLCSVLDHAPTMAPDSSLRALAKTASRDQLREELGKFDAHYRNILRQWSVVTQRQTAAILTLLN